MNRLPNALIDELVDDLEPVRPMKLAHGIGLVALAALVTIGLVELLDGLWRGILAGEASAYYFIANGMLGLLGAALALEIGQPDDDMMRDLIVSHAARRGLMLGEDALTYVVPRMTRSFAAAERFVAVLDRLALERQARPTRNLCRDALETLYGPDQGRLL